MCKNAKNMVVNPEVNFEKYENLQKNLEKTLRNRKKIEKRKK